MGEHDHYVGQAQSLWIDDYMLEAADLSLEEHGLFWRLVSRMWIRGEATLPCDRKYLIDVTRATEGEFDRAWPRVAEMFASDGEHIGHPQLAAELKKARQTGKWRPEGWVPSNERRLYGDTWPAQRRLALKRDGRRCVYCLTEKSVQVHHIKPILRFAGNTKAANDLANLISLCFDCHRWEHWFLRMVPASSSAEAAA